MLFKSPSRLSFSKRRQHHPRDSLYANCGRSLKIAFGCCRRKVASDQDADIRIKKLTPSAQRHEQFSRERYDGSLLETAAIAHSSFFKPQGKRRLRLMAQPYPCELDEGGSQSWIACFRHVCVPKTLSALMT